MASFVLVKTKLKKSRCFQRFQLLYLICFGFGTSIVHANYQNRIPMQQLFIPCTCKGITYTTCM